ncbi:MAG: hypothetical protein K9I94_02670 [Bacteroidales bacterium]|nr:hypothetical protein [Bacteroidales bacterium]
MKAKSIILIGIMGLLFSGCLVKSLHPYYEERDVVFKPELLGSYMDADETAWKISRYSFSKGFMKGDSIDNSYLVEMQQKDAKRVSRFNVHLFELEGINYLDFAPIREDRDEVLMELHLVPAHSIAQIEIISDNEITISWFEEEWLTDLFKENRVKIAHEVITYTDELEPTQYVLTAGTSELQKFLIKYGKTKLPAECDEYNSVSCTTLKRK